MAVTFSKNTANRKFDIDWFSISESSQIGEVNFEFKSKSRKVTGLEKMAQKWTYILLTPVGSDPFEPDLGTDLYLLLEANASDKRYISNIVSSSIASASEQLLQIQSEIPNLPLDEKFSAAVLLSLDFELQAISVKVQLVNMQGSSRIYVLPTPLG